MTWSTLTLFTHRGKVVVVGAVSYYVGHLMPGWISRFTYDATPHVSHEPLNPEHVKRERDASGDRRVPGDFDIMPLGVCHRPLFLLVVLDVLSIYRRKLKS